MLDGLSASSVMKRITAWGVGNVVSKPTGNAVEDLAAQGFGTLRARQGMESNVQAVGVWDLGSYRGLFRRPLGDSTDGAAPLRGGRPIPIAFAVWDGSAGDRDGKKSVTIWQDLVIAP